LHHHPGHSQTAQMVGQAQQRAGHRGVGGHLLQPSPRSVLVRDAHAAGQLGLAEIQRRDALDDLLGLLGLGQHLRPAWVGFPPRWLPAGTARDERTLIHVLEATLKLPMRSSQRPGRRRPHTIKELRRQQAATCDFQPGTGVPQGYLGLDEKFQSLALRA
jgi:hypothetical protein